MDTIIGIHDWEKQSKQTVFLDMDLSHDCREAARTDDIRYAMDYFAVCTQVSELVNHSEYNLIETLAEQIAQLVLTKFNCQKVKLTLYKPGAIPEAQSVGITIKRSL